MYEAINNYISRCASISESEMELFNSLLKKTTVPKKTYLLQEGEICNFEAFIIKGCIRSFYIDENGFEVILQFAIEDWWVSDIASFHDQKPSNIYIETLEDCELFILSDKNKEELLNQIPQFERVFRLMVQKNLSATQNRLITTIAKTATEKLHLYACRDPENPPASSPSRAALQLLIQKLHHLRFQISGNQF